MSADHICDAKCVCSEHPDLRMYYSPARDEHACADHDCVHAHGEKIEDWLTEQHASFRRMKQRRTNGL